MSIKRPDLYEHQNPDLAIVDSNGVRGGRRVVADRAALYALASKADQLKEGVTIVRILSDADNSNATTEVLLIDDTQIGSPAGWELYATGGSGTPVDPGADFVLYTGTGQGTDGAMTQKATTDALAGKSDQGHTHDYNTLTNKPNIPQAPDLTPYATHQEVTDASTADRARGNHTGTQPASTITGLGAVATSNNYQDLTNKPTLPTPQQLASVDALASAVLVRSGNGLFGFANLEAALRSPEAEGGIVSLNTPYAELPASAVSGLHTPQAMYGNGGTLKVMGDLPLGERLEGFSYVFGGQPAERKGRLVTTYNTIIRGLDLSGIELVAPALRYISLDDNSNSNGLILSGAGQIWLVGTTVNLTNTSYGTGFDPATQLLDKRGTGGGGAAYTLPVASATTLGGVKVGAGLSMTDGVLSASGQGGTSYDDAELRRRTIDLEGKVQVLETAVQNYYQRIVALEARPQLTRDTLFDLLEAGTNITLETTAGGKVRINATGSTTPPTGTTDTYTDAYRDPY